MKIKYSIPPESNAFFSEVQTEKYKQAMDMSKDERNSRFKLGADVPMEIRFDFEKTGDYRTVRIDCMQSEARDACLECMKEAAAFVGLKGAKYKEEINNALTDMFKRLDTWDYMESQWRKGFLEAYAETKILNANGETICEACTQSFAVVPDHIAKAVLSETVDDDVDEEDSPTP